MHKKREQEEADRKKVKKCDAWKQEKGSCPRRRRRRRLVRQLNSWHKERGELLAKAARKNAQVNNNNQHLPSHSPLPLQSLTHVAHTHIHSCAGVAKSGCFQSM